MEAEPTMLDRTAGHAPATNAAPTPGVTPEARARKVFVLDTNVLLHNAESLFSFGDNHVVVPFTVIEELDQFKKNNDETGRNARQVIRHLDRLRQRGRLADGVTVNGTGGIVQVDFSSPEPPPGLRGDHPDNRIISVAWKHQSAGQHTVFISKDINARIKSDALGIRTEDFEAQRVDAEHLYTGYRELDVDTATIDTLYDQKQLPVTALDPFLKLAHDDPHEPEPLPAIESVLGNQFVILRDATDPSHTGLGRRLGDTDQLVPVTAPRKPVFGVMARNVQQTMALDLLLDDQIKLVTLLGTAGSGKTLLALAAGMSKVVVEERFDRLLVGRPIMPLGRDIGYLPGDIEDKLSAWMQPIFDNLTYLLSTRTGAAQVADSKTPEQRIKALLGGGQIVLEPLTYIRGRSIANQFMIVDEAQNLTPHEVKTIASRVGEGTKLILTGDVQQIDNPYLDAASNGLAYLVDQLKGQALVGHVTLAKSERSELASLAATKL